jgi:nickel/cobalt exporter
MPDIAHLIEAGAANPWLYLPVAVVLGALHALEPGHSKSLMAAFIIAVRGTPGQAVLLGVSAAIGHTIVVWAIAALGLTLGDRLILDKAEPWLVLVSGLLVVALALRIFFLLRREQGFGFGAAGGHAAQAGHHHHDDAGGHHHHDGHGHRHDEDHHHHDGLGQDHHGHGHHHDHDHAGHRHEPAPAPGTAAAAPLDAHAAAHEREIRARFAGGRRVSAGEVAWFGFTGGLLPCPAAIAVLLVCLQLKEFTLGIGMVAAFSVGLAATLVAVGLAAAWGADAARARWTWFEGIGSRLPYASAAIVLGIGAFITAKGVYEIAGLAG